MDSIVQREKNNLEKINKLNNSKNSLWKRMSYYKYFYLLILPAVIFYIIFSYMPMYGVVLAFKNFSYSKGILRSPWAARHGFEHFYRIFSDAAFKKAFANTLIISVQRIIFEFPVPIILALLINEIGKSKYKRFVQTVLTFPHFVSWIIVTGIFFNILSDQGVLNQIIVAFGGEKVSILTQKSTFRALLYVTNNWKEAGWGTIIYLAAISGVSIELYEAAIVDGAKRFQLVKYVTWPAIRSTIGIMLILAIANIMNAGFDQIFNMYNAAVYDVADIIDTLIYRRTFIIGADFSSSTAIGLFKSVVNFIMLFTGNAIVKKMSGRGIY
ncbi:MAG TPA: ABC transporter permease subunit [Clostridiales bacterium]|nr:ABC transporter permease subunit [Clostridiales bacterium]